MRTLFNPAQFILVLSCLLSASINPQSQPSKFKYQIEASFLESQCTETLYDCDPMDPENVIIRGWIYNVKLTIELHGDDFTWNRPFLAHFVLPDGSEHDQVLNQDMFTLNDKQFYEYYFTFETCSKGLINVALSQLNDSKYPKKENVNFKNTSGKME
jgi:hypothetical protein